MRRLLFAPLALAATLFAAFAIPGAALGATPVDAEFQVNTYTTGHQLRPSVGSDADGNFVVIWDSLGSSGSDTSSRSVQGQRYDPSGNPVGAEFQVNTYTTSDQYRASVGVNAGGDFVVAWESFGSSGSDSDRHSIQGQRYDASGNTVGAEFQVNTLTTGRQHQPSVAVDADGGFVVVYQSTVSLYSNPVGYTLNAQRFDASGAAAGAEFQVNTTEEGVQADVEISADGGFIVNWTGDGFGDDTTLGSVQGQRYDASGNMLGTQFQVNTYTTQSQQAPSVGVDADGNFVIAWTSRWSAAGDLDYSVQGQRYDASGNMVGAQFQVNTYTTQSQQAPSVGVDADGNFVVVWQSRGSAGSDLDYSVQGQSYDASGNMVGAQFQVNTYTTGSQGESFSGPEIAVDTNGDFVVVWSSEGSSGSDTSFRSIQGQRFAGFGFELISSGLPNVAVNHAEDGTTVITGTDGSGRVLTEIILPDGTTFPTGTVFIFFDESGTNAYIDTAGADVPVPPGKSLRIVANPGSNFACVVDDPELVSTGGLPNCSEGTNLSISQVVLICDADGKTKTISGFPDPPIERTYTCTTSFENGQTYVTVEGLAFSFVSPGRNPVVPALRPTGVLALTVLLMGAGALMLRRRLRFPS
jgi:hypothetical protein